MDPMEQGRIGAILGREVTPRMQQVVGRIENTADLSEPDQQAVVTALQKAFIAGAQAAGREKGISNWELPWGDQWANDHGQDGA
jgi:hypothetical protein